MKNVVYSSCVWLCFILIFTSFSTCVRILIWERGSTTLSHNIERGFKKKQIGTMPAAGCCFIFCPGSTWRAGSQDQVTLFAWTTDINIVYMDLSRCEQTGHHCRLVQCLQKQVSSSPKCIAHYNIIHHSMTQWKMLKITVLRMSILIGWW